MSELPIALDRSAATPLAEQLAGQIRRQASDGLLRVGEKLPSTRALAMTLRISRTVTAAAYDQLYAEGWLAAKRGSGTYLVAVPLRTPPVDLGGVVAGKGFPATTPPRSTEWGGREMDLRTGSPWAAGVRPDVWRRAWRAAADAPPDRRPARAGMDAFRAVVADHVVRHRGLLATPADVLATGGTTAAVAELGRAVFRSGDTVAVEEPGYPRAVGALTSAGMRVVPVPVDDHGLVVEALPDDAAAVYCTPAHQFPLGGTLPANRRVDLIAWAREHGAWVIEDDYDGEFRYDVAPMPLLASLGPDVVIHLGTASKIVTPTLGCGWLVGPPEVVDAVLGMRVETGTGPSPAGQRVLTALATSGDLSRHLRRVSSELSARRELVVEKLGAAGHPVQGDKAGAHIVVVLPDLDTERMLIAEARTAGLHVDGLERCFIGPPSRAGLTLGYAAPSDRATVAESLATLTDAVLGVVRSRNRGPA